MKQSLLPADDANELLSMALSGYSANANDITDLKVGQARLEEKLDAHMETTNEQLAKVLEAVNYTNGKVRRLDLWKAKLEGVEMGKTMATGKKPLISVNRILIALITAITAVSVAIISSNKTQ